MSSVLKQVLASIAALVLVTAVILCVLFVHHFGGIGEVLQLPAIVDSSTPASQDGFDLVAVMRSHGDGSNFVLPDGAKMYLPARQDGSDTVLFIRPPQLPYSVLRWPSVVKSSDPARHFFHIDVTSSANDRFTIPWFYEGGCLLGGGEPCSAVRTTQTAPNLIGLMIPSGYPNDIKFFDIAVSDKAGHHARWRLTRLPRMRSTETAAASAGFMHGGAAVQLWVTRSTDPSGTNDDHWSKVAFNLTLMPLMPHARHKWEFTPSPHYAPSLSWEPYRLPWLTSDSFTDVEENIDDAWLLSREKFKAGTVTTISSPYTRDNNRATYHGVLSQFETREDSIDIHNVPVNIIYATEAGMKEDTFCLALSHRIVVKSTAGLTITLPKQHKSARRLLFMAPNSLNLLWRLAPLTPGQTTATAGYLPDSPLCQEFKKPVSVWFEAFVNGKPLGRLDGLPYEPSDGTPPSVSFPAPIMIPSVIKDFRITIHQRVDLQRIPVTLSAKIVDEAAG